MALEQKDLESIERLIIKNGDDVAVSVARSFERLEERIDAAESRIYSRLADVEDKIETGRQDVSDELGLAILADAHGQRLSNRSLRFFGRALGERFLTGPS